MDPQGLGLRGLIALRRRYIGLFSISIPIFRGVLETFDFRISMAEILAGFILALLWVGLILTKAVCKAVYDKYTQIQYFREALYFSIIFIMGFFLTLVLEINYQSLEMEESSGVAPFLGSLFGAIAASEYHLVHGFPNIARPRSSVVVSVILGYVMGAVGGGFAWVLVSESPLILIAILFFAFFTGILAGSFADNLDLFVKHYHKTLSPSARSYALIRLWFGLILALVSGASVGVVVVLVFTGQYLGEYL